MRKPSKTIWVLPSSHPPKFETSATERNLSHQADSSQVQPAFSREEVEESFWTTGMAVPQNIAIGLTGAPVPFSTRSGATVKRNVQRFREVAACVSSSKSQLSNSGVPMAINNN